MAEPGDPPIIVSGGSVTVEFDKTQLSESDDGKQHHHPHKKINRIEITGGDLELTGDAKSGFVGKTESGKVKVKIFYGDK
jgi:hypothetical protein